MSKVPELNLAAAWRLPWRLGGLAAQCWTLRRARAEGPPQSAAALRAVAAQVQHTARGLCTAHGLEVTRGGAMPEGPVIMVANHVSYVDTLVLPSLTPSTCIAKREVAAWPGVGHVAERLGILFVNRGDAHSGALVLRRARRALQAGVTVIAYPEGTTTAGDRLLPFHRGVFGLARLMNVPVLPVSIEYADPRIAWVGEASFLRHYLTTVGATRKTSVTVRLGPLLPPAAFGSAHALAQAARQVIARSLWASV